MDGLSAWMGDVTFVPLPGGGLIRMRRADALLALNDLAMCGNMYVTPVPGDPEIFMRINPSSIAAMPLSQVE